MVVSAMWDIDGRDKKVKLELERLAKKRRDEGSRDAGY